MLSLGALAFATPWVLLAGLLLPIIWLLLRITPPAPKQLRFPAITFLFGLTPREETPAHTPWWLLLLRIVLAALVIIGLAHPLLNPRAAIIGGGPLILVLDDGWAAARDWNKKRASAIELTDQAERDNRPMVLLTTAAEPGNEPPLAVGPQRPAEIRAKLQALQPHPWPSDRAAALAAFEPLQLTGSAETIWISDGLEDAAVAPLAERLQRLGSVTVLTPAAGDLPYLLMPPENTPGTLDFTVKRAAADEAGLTVFRAVAGDGHLLDREPVRFDAGQDSAIVHLKLPVELRNALARADLEGQDEAGAAVLLDERWARRPVGVVAGSAHGNAQSLLDDNYYLERALGPFAELRLGPIGDLLHTPLSLILLPDSGLTSDSDRGQLEQFIQKGGVLVRFAGPNLAGSDTDKLLPVRLRGSRTLGSAMQWTAPEPLAGFEAKSPFAGLAVPGDVTVSRQVLAEPSIDLADRTWARLADGTPLVTAEHRGEGWLVLFHVPATADWSNLPISGVFVEMLRRLVSIGQGVGAGVQQVAMPAQETLDGFARLGAAPGTAAALQPGEEAVVGPKHPPGFYGTEQLRRSLNLTSGIQSIAALKSLPQGVARAELALAGEKDLRPWLLTIALVIGLVDLVIALALRGLLGAPLGRGTAAGVALLLMAAAAGPAAAQDKSADDPAFALKATLQTHLAYVETGDKRIDDVSLAGLRGLTLVLNRRTAVEAEEPMAVDVEHDELAFFPLLYWPIVTGQAPLSSGAIDRINFFLRNGGTILFDTRDTDSAELDPRGGEGQRRLQELARGLEIPQLIPVPPEHVLTKAFYLMQNFPGRYSGGTLWVESKDSGNDEVSSVIVGSNDYAAAWAVDRSGRPMFATSPGGELQREQAFRFGVNLMMYALTGNYKTDQVHVPSILERLGQ